MAQKNSTREVEFVSVEQIQELLGLAESTAYQKVRKVNEQLEQQGFLTVKGKLPKVIFEKLIAYQNADLSKISL